MNTLHSSGHPKRPRINKPTLADIAQLAQVSIATVSKVINGKEDVAPSTRQRIEQVIEELGYFRSTAPKPASNLIELVFQHLDNSWSLDLLHGAATEAQSRGARIVVSEIENTSISANQPAKIQSAMEQWVDEVLIRRPLGVIMVYTKPTMQLANRLRSRSIPCVFIDPWGNPMSGTMSIQADNWSGGLFATRHLIELGHRTIATITGPNTAMCANARLDGYHTAFREADIEIDKQLCKRGLFTVEDGEQSALELLRMTKRPTAIVAQSDYLAMGVYKAAQSLHVRIPEDISVVGFDDIQTAAYMGPALTTIHQPLEEMARTAVRRILEAQDGHPREERTILPTSLIIRDSTAALR